MLSYLRTYLLGDGDVLSRVVLAGLLRVVRYRPLALVGVRHFELLVSLVALGRSQLEGSKSKRSKCVPPRTCPCFVELN
jgi:hypothetical protein